MTFLLLLLIATATAWKYVAYSDPDCGGRIQEAAYYSIWTNLSGSTPLNSPSENACISLAQPSPNISEIDILFLDHLGYIEPTEQGTFTTPKSQYLKANATCEIYPGNLVCEGEGVLLMPKLGAIANMSRCINGSLPEQEGEWSMRCKSVLGQVGSSP